jgi:hypothetical protein
MGRRITVMYTAVVVRIKYVLDLGGRSKCHDENSILEGTPMLEMIIGRRIAWSPKSEA